MFIPTEICKYLNFIAITKILFIYTNNFIIKTIKQVSFRNLYFTFMQGEFICMIYFAVLLIQRRFKLIFCRALF